MIEEFSADITQKFSLRVIILLLNFHVAIWLMAALMWKVFRTSQFF